MKSVKFAVIHILIPSVVCMLFYNQGYKEGQMIGRIQSKRSTKFYLKNKLLSDPKICTKCHSEIKKY